MKNVWFVSCQSYWPDGQRVVEIAYGGLDYANADMLVAKWSKLGEGDEFTDPREAVEAAIAICREWRKTAKPWPRVAHGYTAGMTIPFEEGTFAEARAWAKVTWDKLEKCACGQPLPDKSERWHNEWRDEDFCSESCADKDREWRAEQNALLDEELAEIEADQESELAE